ncbi:hypothetical protein RCZ04_22360 [Capnocytophaga sp. HP1101]
MGTFLAIVVISVLYVLFLPVILGKGMGDFLEIMRYPHYYENLMTTPAVQMKMTVLAVLIVCIITPLSAGFYENFRNLDRGEAASANNLFVHYASPYTGRLLAYAILASLLNSVISYLAILVGVPVLNLVINIFISMLLTFTIPIIVFENQPLFKAIESSCVRIMNNFGIVFLSLLIGSILASLGVLVCGIGLIFSFPYIYATIYAAYTDEIRKTQSKINKTNI